MAKVIEQVHNQNSEAVINRYRQLYGDAQFDAALSLLFQPLTQPVYGSYSTDELGWLNKYETMVKLLQPLIKQLSTAHINTEHQALLFYYLGLASHRMGQEQRASEYTSKALHLAFNLKDNRLQIKALYEIASAFLTQRDYEQAINSYKQIVALAQKTDNAEEAAWSLDRIGMVYGYYLGDFQKGITYFYQALKVAEQTDNEALVSKYRSELGAAYQQAKQYEQAIECYNQALNLARSAGDKTGEGGSLSDLGSAYQAQGKLNEAVTFYRQAFEIFEQSDNKEAASLIADDLAEAYVALGDEEKAAYYSGREAEYDAVIFA